jgi:hypothetical protein
VPCGEVRAAWRRGAPTSDVGARRRRVVRVWRRPLAAAPLPSAVAAAARSPCDRATTSPTGLPAKVRDGPWLVQADCLGIRPVQEAG